jgi:hypothetical protein
MVGREPNDSLEGIGFDAAQSLGSVESLRFVLRDGVGRLRLFDSRLFDESSQDLPVVCRFFGDKIDDDVLERLGVDRLRVGVENTATPRILLAGQRDQFESVTVRKLVASHQHRRW